MLKKSKKYSNNHYISAENNDINDLKTGQKIMRLMVSTRGHTRGSVGFFSFVELTLFNVLVTSCILFFAPRKVETSLAWVHYSRCVVHLLIFYLFYCTSQRRSKVLF